MDPKAWYLSRAVWGGVVAILAGLLSAFGINLDEAAQVDAVNIGLALAGAIGGALAIYGRVKASAPIGKPTVPPGPGTATALLMAAMLGALVVAGPIACASRVAETPAQTVYGIQADLTVAQRTALAFIKSDQASPAAKDAVKRLDATAVDAVKAAQDAVRAGGGPTIPAAIATARNAVDTLLHYLAEGNAR